MDGKACLRAEGIGSLSGLHKIVFVWYKDIVAQHIIRSSSLPYRMISFTRHVLQDGLNAVSLQRLSQS